MASEDKRSLAWWSDWKDSALFAEGTSLQLTERQQPPGLLSAVSAGCTLSTIHANGVVHGDIHNENAVFDAQTGTAWVFDFGNAVNTEVNAQQMATDFLVPLAKVGFPWCQALLAGYLKGARLCIEPKVPGYCDDLLDILGGSVESECRQRVATLPVETLNESLGWLGGDLQVERDPVVFWTALTSPAQCVYTIGGLIAAGVDCSVLVTDSPITPRTSAHAAVRDLLVSAGRNEALGSCPPGVPPAGWDFITRALASDESQASEEPPTVKPNMHAMRTIPDLLSEHPQSDLDEMLCSFVEICDWLAARADIGGSGFPTDLTVQSAQTTYMLLQLVAAPEVAESAELAAATRHARLSWHPCAVDDRVEVDDKDLPYLLTYANSRIAAYRHLFEGQEQSDAGRQWTASWRAGAMGRVWLRRLLIRRMKPGEEPHESPALLDQAIYVIANNLAGTLFSYLPAVLLAHGSRYLKMTDQEQREGGFTPLKEEIEALMQLRHAAGSREFGSTLTPDYLELGIKYLERYSQVYIWPFDREIAK